MAKGKVPAGLAAYQFKKKGSKKAAPAKAKGKTSWWKKKAK